MAGKKGQRSGKRKQLPTALRAGWLAKGDGRTRAYRKSRASLAELVEQYGGIDNLSAMERRLLERVIHVELLAWGFEERLRQGKPIEVAAYLACIDRLHGVAKTLGLKRVAKRVPSLQEYIGKEAPTDGR